MTLPEKYFRTADGRIGFWDPLASAIYRKEVFHAFGENGPSREIADLDPESLEPLEHESVFITLAERGASRTLDHHPTEAGARAVYSGLFLGRTYDGHLFVLTEIKVPIVSPVAHVQVEYVSDFVRRQYFPDWARTTLTWASSPCKLPRESYAARITGTNDAGWVDRTAPERPDGRLPVYLGDRVRFEPADQLDTNTFTVYASNWRDSDGDCYLYGQIVTDEDTASLAPPTEPVIDCRAVELREWHVPGIASLDGEGERVAALFIQRGLAYGDRGARINWHDQT